MLRHLNAEILEKLGENIDYIKHPIEAFYLIHDFGFIKNPFQIADNNDEWKNMAEKFKNLIEPKPIKNVKPEIKLTCHRLEIIQIINKDKLEDIILPKTGDKQC